jgi:hypothetical protein
MEITYVPAETPLDNSEGMWATKNINIAALKSAIYNYIIGRNTIKDPNVIILFDAYAPLGLPIYSYISMDSLERLNSEVCKILFNYADINTILGKPTIGTVKNHIFFNYNMDKPQFPGYETNKIHLLVKHEYIFDCILRLTNFHTFFPDNRVTWKVYIWNKDSKLNPGDTVLREVNGGVAATFILYGSSNTDIMKKMIRKLLEFFPRDDIYGLMDLTGTDTITAGHVRINHMISYGSSDRGALLDARDANMKEFKKGKVLPAWIKTLPCDNVLSQLYIGKDVCDSGGERFDLEALCNTEPNDAEKKDPISRNFCYMNPDTFDPRVLTASSGGGKTRRSSRSKRSTTKKKKHVRKQYRKNTGRAHH